jgi:hypothetical protein
MLMAEKNVKPKENAESLPKEQSQSPNQNEVVEEAYFFHPVKLSEESGETLDEKEIDKSKVEI